MSKQIDRELETKFRSTKAQNKEVVTLVSGWAFVLLSKGQEKNIYFDTLDGRLESSKATVRLREDATGYLLTVKEKTDKKNPSGDKRKHYKDQKEGNVRIEKPDVIRKALALFGVKEISYKKIRQHWRLVGGRVCIEVDFVPELNKYFIEIEAPSKQEINRFRRKLGFSWDDVEPKSYIELIRAGRQDKKHKKR